METLKLFSEELKEQRKLLEITITDIFDKTRIDKKYLEAMENGDFEIMPQVYMRAFIRKYAEAVDLDPNEVMLKYDAARSGKTYEEISNNSDSDYSDENEEKPIPPSNSNNDNGNSKYIVLVITLLIVVVGIAATIFITSGSDEIIVEKAIEDIISERTDNQTERYEIDSSAINNSSIMTNNEITTDSLSLKIYAVDTVWVQLLIDNTTTAEYILYPTRSKNVKAKSQIDVLLGNSGGVEFTLNERKIEFSGKKGEIKSLIIDENGIRYPEKKSLSNNE
jgi:cytoskeletal protein RodZ